MSDFVQADKITGAKQALDRLRTNMRLTIRGKDDVIEQVLVCLVAGGHLLIEDLPGVGKTTLAYSLARSMDCAFSRLQFTSDLLPSDVTGVAIYDETGRGCVVQMGYPRAVDELEILRTAKGGYDAIALNAAITRGDVLKLQSLVHEVFVEESVLDFILKIVAATRTESEFRAGASVRAGIALRS